MAAEFEVEIREDGSLKVETGNMAGPHHGSADDFMAMLATLMGGAVDKKSKRKGLKHSHKHHGHEHVHADGTKHTH